MYFYDKIDKYEKSASSIMCTSDDDPCDFLEHLTGKRLYKKKSPLWVKYTEPAPMDHIFRNYSIKALFGSVDVQGSHKVMAQQELVVVEVGSILNQSWCQIPLPSLFSDNIDHLFA